MTLPLDTIEKTNCREFLRALPNASVDLVVTDPPYSVGTTSNGRKADWHDNNLIVPFFEEVFGELRRVLKPGGEIYVNTDWRTYPLLYPSFAMRFIPRNLIVWDYGWIKAGSYYRHRHEFIMYGTGSDTPRRFSGSEPDVWNNKPLNFTRPDKRHPTEKPVGLVARMIRNSSQPGDIVLDPFAGSGTSLVVAKHMGRRYMGCEISETYHSIASARIASGLTPDEIEALGGGAS